MSGLEGARLGRYHFYHLLGRGGMAEVYLAHDKRLNRDVAIKVLSSTDPACVARFRREAEAIGWLNHDHILPAFDYGEQGPWHYLVMPYMKHATLRERLAASPLTPEEAGEILTQVADALQYAHDHHIVHRDIKPSNILFRDDHHVYLADFGLAKSLEMPNDVTPSGNLLGTPEYMAPDLAYGPATPSSDIYALGVLLYQMVTGRVPFVADMPLAVFMKHLYAEPVPPSLMNPALPRTLDAVILRALEKDPVLRFKTTRAFAESYRRALSVARQYEADQRPYLTQATERASISLLRSRAPSFSQRASFPAAMPHKLLLSSSPPITPALTTPRYDVSTNYPMLAEREAEVGTGEAFTPAGPIERSVVTTRRSRRADTPVISIVALGILLFIVLPMACLYYMYSTTNKAAVYATTSSHDASAAATVITPGTPTTLIPENNLMLTDALAHSTPGRWEENSVCGFSAGRYRVMVKQSDFLQPCSLLMAMPDALKMSVDVSLISGHDAGLLLNLQNQHFYDFEITKRGQFFFRRHDDHGGSSYVDLIPNTFCNAIAEDGQKNTLTVIDKDGDFLLYINNAFVGEVHDTTYSSGHIALVAGTLASETSGVGAFSNFTLSKVEAS